MRQLTAFGAAACATLAISACGGGGQNTFVSAPVVAPAPQPQSGLSFSDQTMASGLNFSHGFDPAYTAMPSLFAGGAAVGDIDDDGDLDLFIVRGDRADNLLLINANGRFSRDTRNPMLDQTGGPSNSKLSGPIFVDFDQDGHLDLFIGGLNNEGSRLFKGHGTGGFTDVTAGSGIDKMTSENTISASAGDYDGDGDLDLAMAHWGTPRLASMPGETETLWRNDSVNGAITFTPVSDPAGISAGLGLNVDGKIGRDRDYSFVPNFIDIDGDNDLDLLLVADFRSSRVFENKGDGTFSNATDPTQITDANGMGTDIGDFNNDGRPDWFVSSINANVLYENMSGMMISRSNSGAETGAWGWGSCFADFDLDGDLDIYQTNGWVNNTGSSPSEPYDQDRSRLWINNNGDFSDEADAVGLGDTVQGRAVICADFDNDLDVDILLLVNGSTNGAIYWRNDISSRNSIGVRLVGPATNKAGIGATIIVDAGTTKQTRWVRAGSTFTAQTAPVQIFGLGGSRVASKVTVDWPDGKQSVLENVGAGTAFTVEYPN